MKKTSSITISILSGLFLFAACAASSNHNEKAPIKGTIKAGENKKITLERLGANKVEFIDSTRIDENGQFSFDVKIKQAGFYRLAFDQRNFFNLVLDSGEQVLVKADASNLSETYSVEGSEQSLKLKTLNDELTRFYKQTDSLGKAMQTLQAKGDMNAMIQGQMAYQSMNQEHMGFIKSFIDENLGSLVTLATLQKLNPDQDAAYFKKIANGLKQTMPNSDYYASIQAKVASMSAVSVGSEAPEISLQTPEGKTVSLSDYRGKVVLVDFWASWCRPCRAENPNVVRVYNKYKDKGFDVLGVSLDQRKNSWLSAIEKDGLTWNHISDLKGWQSSVVPVYKIKGIPHTVLVGKDGKILAKNLRGPALEQKLKSILK